MRMSASRLQRCLTLSVLVLLLAAAPAFADQTVAAEPLRRMEQALRNLDYHGAFIYQAGARLDAFALSHRGGEVDHEYLRGLSGTDSEAWRQGGRVVVSRAERKASILAETASATLLPLVPRTAGALPVTYALRDGGVDRVAGRTASITDLVPVDGYRHGYRLWLDRDSQLPLRAAIIGADQRLLEQVMFVELTVGTTQIPDEPAVQPNVSAASQDAEIPVAGEPRWRVDPTPPGYQLRGRLALAGSPSAGAEHLLFSDGIASVSVYVEAVSDDSDDDVAMTRGAMNVYVHRIGEWRLTAMGNVPAATVQYFATMLQPVPEPPRQ